MEIIDQAMFVFDIMVYSLLHTLLEINLET